MAELVVGSTANQVWGKAADLVLNKGQDIQGRSGETRELLHTLITINNPSQKWVYDRIPPLSIAFAFAELVWIMNGEDRADIINTWNPILGRYAGKSNYYHGAYGKRIRLHFNFDQLEQAHRGLQSNPESRQFVIQIYDTQVDFPMIYGNPRSEDIPCNICSMPKIRNGKLEWTQIMRSNDLLLGMPYNFVQFTYLQEILSGWLGVEAGSYNHFSDSLHLYKRDFSRFGNDNTGDMFNCDTLDAKKDDSDQLFKEMYGRMKILALNKLSEKEMHSLSQLKCSYNAYNNVMLVLSAYIAKKAHYNELVDALMQQCDNNLYKVMWKKWSNYQDKHST